MAVRLRRVCPNEPAGRYLPLDYDGQLWQAGLVARDKKSRKERLKRQRERAAASGDLDTLERLAATAPTGAAETCTRLLAGTEGQLEPKLEALAVRLARDARQNGRAKWAVELGRAGTTRSRPLQLEAALAAFALGDDDTALELVGDDRELQVVVEPLVSAVRGRSPPRLRGKSPALTALHGAAGAVARTVGESPDRPGALRSLKRIPEPLRDGFWHDELRTAIDLVTSNDPPDRVAIELQQSDRFRANPVLVSALIDEVTGVGGSTVRHGSSALCMDPRRAAALLRGDRRPEPAQAVQAVAALELARFPESQRAVAHLYRGFAALQSNPQQACTSFERALAAGADEVECLRGRWLAIRRAALAQPSWKRTGKRLHDDRSDAARHLAQALGRQPHGNAARLALCVVMAKTCSSENRPEPEWATEARDLGQRLGQSQQLMHEMALDEAHAWLGTDPKRSADLAESLVKSDPGNGEAWLLRLDAARLLGSTDEDELLSEAERSTDHPEIITRALTRRHARDDLRPFAVVPSPPHPGRLALELTHLVMHAAETADARDRDPSEAMARAFEDAMTALPPHRDALRREDRLALDAAILLVMSESSIDVAPELGRMVREYGDDARALTKLATVLTLRARATELVASMRDALERDQIAAVVTIFTALRDAAPELASRFLKTEAARLPYGLTRQLQTLMSHPPEFTDPEALLAPLTERLRPYFDLNRSLEEADDPVGFSDELVDQFNMIISVLGGDPERFHALPPSRQEALLAELVPVIKAGPSKSMQREGAAILARHGVGSGS